MEHGAMFHEQRNFHRQLMVVSAKSLKCILRSSAAITIVAKERTVYKENRKAGESFAIAIYSFSRSQALRSARSVINYYSMIESDNIPIRLDRV